MIIERIKILLISPLPPPAGGIASWTEQFVNWSIKNGQTIEVVNTSVIGSRAIKINNKTRVIDEIRRSMFIFRNLFSKIRTFNPSLVHLNTSCSKMGMIRDCLVAKYVKHCRKPLVIHYHCNIEDQINQSKFSKFLFKILASNANLNLVLNYQSLKYINEVANQKATKIPNFIDQSLVLNKPKVIAKDIKKVVFVGHVQSSKGIIEIIEAARNLIDLEFEIIGPIKDNLESICKPENVKFLGIKTRDDVIEALKKADLFLFPTYTEGFANVILEAMSVGLPIITTSVGANEEMLENKGGIIIPTRNANAIVEAIKVIGNKDVRESMSKWNMHKVRDKYTTGRVISDLMTKYIELINLLK